MIAALILALFPLPGVLREARAEDPFIVVGKNLDRDAVLRRDPRALPHAAAGKWAGFDVAAYENAEVSARLESVSRDILRSDHVAALNGLFALAEAEPDFPPALHMLGVLYFRLQRYGDSAYMLERYVALVPNRVGDTRVLGHDLYTLGRYEEAREHYAKVLAHAPADVEAQRGMALTLWRLGEFDAALALLNVAIERAPTNDELWSWKATIAFDAGETQAARTAAERALELDAFEPRTWYALARILDELGEAEPAAAARARFERLAAASTAVRHAEARLLFAPDQAELLARWMDTLLALGHPGRVRAALRRIEDSRAAGTLPGRSARLVARVALGRAGEAAELARELERDAGDDRRAWIALLRWFEARDDATGVARAQGRLGR
ncbi:MAG: tetratricopeptide repeat protein [Planctomycetes bacterium]|nr:tetratricopeptide repeat protein [Planctomycetota bacterium]